MHKATYAVLYNRRKKLDKRGQAPVEIRVTHCRRSKIFKTGIKIAPTEWDGKQQRIKRQHPHFAQYNRLIRDQLYQLEAFELNQLSESKPFHLDMFSSLEQQPRETSFTGFCQRLVNEDRTLKLQTRKNHQTHLNHFKAFKPEVAFNELTVELLHQFERHLLDYTFHREQAYHQLSDIAIHSILKTMRAYAKKAVKHNHIAYQDDPFLRYSFSKFNRSKSVRKSLKPDQIKQLEQLTFEPNEIELEKIRDAFLLACYTGLSSTDVIGLSKQQIEYAEGEGHSIKMQRGKNDNWFYVPIFSIFGGKAEQIVLKYLLPERNYLFDEFTNQKFNKYLKILAQRASITETLTFHMGRHSCAMYLLYLGMPIEIISKILGHTKLATTQIYANVDKHSIDMAVSRIDFK